MRKTVMLVLSVVALAGCAGPLAAQISSVRIFPDPSGPQFYVDEQVFTGPVTLLWPIGSKHNIRVPPDQIGLTQKIQYRFDSADTNLGPLLSLLPITADPGITFVRLKFSKAYAATLAFFPCSADNPSCLQFSPGRVYMNGELFTSDAERYFPADSTVTLQVYPNPGYVFNGWGPMPGVNVTTAFQFSFPLNQPQVIRPLFNSARPLSVTLTTSPPGLQLLLDRTAMSTPVNLEWGWNTIHSVGAIPVQHDSQGRVMVFDSWSDGGDINHDFKMPGVGAAPVTLSARFVPGAAVSFLTEPPGLKLTIDGRQIWQSYNFGWPAGSSHNVAAPLQQVDSRGRKYKFVSWSQGGDPVQDITVIAAPDDVRYTATYAPVAQISVASVPPGLRVQVDGSDCTTPCALDRDVGVAMRVLAPTVSPMGEGSRLIFQGWTDGASPDRTFTTGADPQVLTARYQWQYRLTVVADPAEGIDWTAQPDSPDGFYDALTTVTLAATPRPGFRFLSWAGDVNATTRAASLLISSPKVVTAQLDRVPFTPPGALRNAAGLTPEDIVAAGSAASIHGVNLAPVAETGPASPLKQTLANVTVRLADRLLPLFFVSPDQINLQLPSDLGEGSKTLIVRWEGKPEVKVDFTVARNAPGLFTSPIDDTPFGAILHADGKPVTPDSPARKGETVTLLGTGFGPLLGLVPDGFALPEGPSFMLADAVEIVAGDAVLKPVYAGVAAGRVGLQAVRVVIGDGLPQSTNVEVKVRVNGHESNTVLLPLE